MQTDTKSERHTREMRMYTYTAASGGGLSLRRRREAVSARDQVRAGASGARRNGSARGPPPDGAAEPKVRSVVGVNRP